MSKTLFWYLFRDLIRVFLLATLVLAGIMSFGGLLRPLTRHGLDLWQVIQMVLYLMPAMMTYSIPIASLFATTIVYGRLSADNELTACRAAGISYFSVAMPALAMGIIISLGSLLFLSYVVPHFSLSVQRVMYANVAKYIANEIERSHELKLVRGGTIIFAQGAYVPPPQEGDIQTVVLVGPTIVTEGRDDSDPEVRVPRSFAMARQATLRIRQHDDDQMQFDADLDGGVAFGRQGTNRPEGGVAQTHIGPIPVPSLIDENVKLMNIERIKQLAAEPEKSRRVRKTLAAFIATEQADVFLRELRAELLARGKATFSTGQETYELTVTGMPVHLRKDTLFMATRPGKDSLLRISRRQADGHVDLLADARTLEIVPQADNDIDRMILTLNLQDARLQIRQDVLEKAAYSMPAISLPMSSELQALRKRTAQQYLDGNYLPTLRNTLARDVFVVRNDAIAEMHGRASFSLSCLVLVLMGCCMGMVFRSGDFLTAFAVCVIPALLTITLVVAGQQTASEIPRDLSPGFHNPLGFSLGLIWSGNAIVALIAIGVMRRLHRH